MASIVLNKNLGDPNATNPKSLILSLSGSGVDVFSLGTGVKYLAFNAVTPLNSVTAILSVFPGTQFRVDTAYNTKTFAIVNSDNTSSLFTCATATTVQTLTSNGYNTLIPEKQRLWNLTND